MTKQQYGRYLASSSPFGRVRPVSVVRILSRKQSLALGFNCSDGARESARPLHWVFYMALVLLVPVLDSRYEIQAQR
jgi:hypothetical protein